MTIFQVLNHLGRTFQGVIPGNTLESTGLAGGTEEPDLIEAVSFVGFFSREMEEHQRNGAEPSSRIASKNPSGKIPQTEPNQAIEMLSPGTKSHNCKPKFPEKHEWIGRKLLNSSWHRIILKFVISRNNTYSMHEKLQSIVIPTETTGIIWWNRRVPSLENTIFMFQNLDPSGTLAPPFLPVSHRGYQPTS